MKKLFYVVEFQLQDIDGIQESNGWKDITVYSIVNDTNEKQFDVTIQIETNSEESIKEYLRHNGMGDEFYEFIRL